MNLTLHLCPGIRQGPGGQGLHLIYPRTPLYLDSAEHIVSAPKIIFKE